MNDQLHRDTKSKPTVFELLDRVTKVSVLVLALSYGLGLLVTNQYLVGLGISDFASVRPKYIVTGFWTLLLILISGLPAFWVWLTIDWKHIRKSLKFLYLKAVLWRGLVGVVTAMVAICSMLSFILRYDDRWYSKANYLLILLEIAAHLILITSFTIILTRIFLFFLLRVAENHPRYKGYMLGYFIAVLIVCFGLSKATSDIAEKVYGNIPEALGGGGSALFVKIFLNDKGEQFWKTTGVPKEDLTSGTTMILYQDDKSLMILVSKQKLGLGRIGERSSLPMILGRDMVGAIAIEQ